MSSTDPFGLIGQVLDGQFRVDKFVGEGGFSVVYRGHHVGLDEPIAIKCLKLPIALGSALVESFVKRFRDESRLHYRLSQGNLFIARTLAHGTTMAPATGALVPYMVLEWLEGRSLAADLEVRRTYGDKGRSMQQAIELLDSAVDGLAYAHANGVVHRDVNPGNLFLAQTAEGPKLKVLDFGVAKVFSDEALALGPRAKTIGQIRIFSPQYAAPEQFDDRLGPIGPWTDVYAIALIALEVLRDAPAIEGEHLGDFASRALDPLARPTPRNLGIAVPDETERVFASAVALKPKARPQDAGELWGALKHAVKLDAEKGNPAYVDRPAPSLVAGGTGATGDARDLEVRPGVTLAFEKVPLPVRASDPVPPPEPSSSEMPPETARMPDAPPHDEPPSAAASRGMISSGSQALAAAFGAGPTPAAFIPSAPVAPLPVESMMRPSFPQDSVIPLTPPATEVKVPTPPPPVPNAFAPNGDAARLAPIPAPPPQLVPPPQAGVPFMSTIAAPHAMGPSAYPTPPPVAPIMGTALMARPSSAPPPASLPPHTVPLPNGGARPSGPAAPVAQSSIAEPPDSEDKPTRVGPGALDALSSLYAAPPGAPPVAVPSAAPPAVRPSDTPTVTTKRGTGERVFAITLALFFVVAALGYVAYTRYGLFHF